MVTAERIAVFFSDIHLVVFLRSWFMVSKLFVEYEQKLTFMSTFLQYLTEQRGKLLDNTSTILRLKSKVKLFSTN